MPYWVGVHVVVVLGLGHNVLLVVVVRVIMIAVVDVPFTRHLGRSDRTVDAGHGFEHTLEGLMVKALGTHGYAVLLLVMSVLDAHVISTFALVAPAAAVIVIVDVEYIAVLHLELRVVGRLGMVELVFAMVVLAGETTARLCTLGFEALALRAVLLSRTVLSFQFDRLLRRWACTFLFWHVDLEWEQDIISLVKHFFIY